MFLLLTDRSPTFQASSAVLYYNEQSFPAAFIFLFIFPQKQKCCESCKKTWKSVYFVYLKHLLW